MLKAFKNTQEVLSDGVGPKNKRTSKTAFPDATFFVGKQQDISTSAACDKAPAWRGKGFSSDETGEGADTPAPRTTT